MKIGRVAIGVYWTVVLLLMSASASAPALDQLSEAERRGKQIYLRGVSQSGGEIRAFLGEAATELPATAAACSGCHGFDGRGRPEGGVTPSDITWEALTKSYGVTHASGRQHPPYTERAVELALTRGIDPAGNRLADTMPRYWMSHEDLADLVAYLKRIGRDRDPGLSETEIVVGTIVPAEGPLSEMGLATEAALAAYFDEVNERGGVFNRKIKLQVIRSAPDPRAARAGLERAVDREPVFAVTAAFIGGAEKEITSLLEEREVPLVAPLTSQPEEAVPPNRHIFYLFSGLKQQARALISFAGDKLPRQPRIAIVASNDPAAAGVKEAVQQECRTRGYGSAEEIGYMRGGFHAQQLARQLNQAGTHAVFLIASGGEAAALLKEAEKLRWTPYVLIPGSLGAREILDAPPVFKDRILLAFPTLPSDQKPSQVSEFRSLAEKHKLSGRHLASQVSAYCAARILVEALKLTGREVSREKLIRTLEGFYKFDTGLSPPVTFGPNRRIGALGAYIVAVDPTNRRFVPVSGWIPGE